MAEGKGGQGFRVIRSESGLFWVDYNGEVIACKARSRLKKDALIVGDFVHLDFGAGEPVITSVLERKNRLFRPSVANIDAIIIMVATTPEIDYILLDKLIINCARQDIETYICLNKSDISENELNEISSQYALSTLAIIRSSALLGDVDEIVSLLRGKLACIAGQSAVGKSTTINALLGYDFQRIGELSEKIERGKNTTTTSEIFKVNGGYIVDTPGFSIVDIFDIEPKDINLYYPEFDRFRKDCKFSTCTHTQEPQCAVKTAVECGHLNKDRYNRYLKIYAECKAAFERRY